MRERRAKPIIVGLFQQRQKLGAIPIVHARLRGLNERANFRAGESADMPFKALGYIKRVGSGEDRRELLAEHALFYPL